MEILQPKLETRRGDDKDGLSKSERQYFDLKNSGKSLMHILKISDQNFVGVLGWGELTN